MQQECKQCIEHVLQVALTHLTFLAIVLSVAILTRWPDMLGIEGP